MATPVVLDRHGRVIAELGNHAARDCHPVALDEVGPWLIKATLAAEDHRFQDHHGIDWISLAGAIRSNLRSGEIVSGASTISQQLIKLHSGPSRRGWTTKVHECIAALRLERELTKDAILERYLNRIDYGNRLRGIEAASRGYFGKAASALTLPEAIYLAGLPQAPSRFNPRTHPERAARRFHQVAGRMRALGWLSGQEVDLSTPPALVAPQSPVSEAPHFVHALRARGTPLSGQVESTLDLELQHRVEGIVSRHLRRLAPSGVRHAAALVIDHRDGSIRAWIGSGDWTAADGQIDGVTLPRSSGSTLKPFLYLRAIDRKVLTAASLLPDTPDAIRVEYPDYDPRNYDDRFWGPVRVREALANSLNVPAVVALSRTGARDVKDYLQRCGIPLARSLDVYGAGMILGNAEVRMLDLAAAYGALGNGGISAPPRFLDTDPVIHRAIASADASAIVADILSDNDARRKTFGPFSPLAFDGVRIPCKTGTSSGFRDAWTFGATGRHVVAVWVGNFSGRPMDEIASVTGPAPAWREIVNLLLDEDGGVAVPGDRPPGLEQLAICPLSGLRPVPGTLQPVMELFLKGTAPGVDAADFFTRDVDGRTSVVLPATYAVWCRSSHNYLDATVRSERSLVIASPRSDARYLFDPEIPARRQKIELIAVGANRQPVHWEIDGNTVEPGAGDGGTFWQLQPGVHRVVARQGAVEQDATFRVE